MQQISKTASFKQILHNMGWRYVNFRSVFEVKKRLGLLKRKFPVNPPSVDHIKLEEWHSNKPPFFKPSLPGSIADHTEIGENADRILRGEFKFFNSEWIDLGKNYDWVTNPDTGYKYNIASHWVDINDYSKDAGDIKYVWEKSRFSFIHTLIRDEHWNKKPHAAFIFSEIDNWMDSNPINQGPNYKCSQEISLRVLNWIWALYYYADDKALTNDRWNRIMHFIFWQMHHVYENIHFSRKAVRNNHAITETLTLYIVGLLFPHFKDSAKWKTKGKTWFEQEIEYQVYEDGTFLQFSMNYHRVVIQLFTWAIGISHLNNDHFMPVVYERAYKSLNFLFQCQEGKQGELPNYGANDGALFFPLNNCGYRDFRPQLNALHEMLCGQALYEEAAAWKEDALWYGTNTNFVSPSFKPLKKISGCTSFPIGGYYLMRDENSFTFIRCGNHKDRPSQADNLHIDIWVNGENILIDGGSYKYNADDKTLRYFMGTASHNTVMLDGYDQMFKGGRFIWYYWTQCTVKPLIEEAEEEFLFTGSIYSFGFLGKGIRHERTIKKAKQKKSWEIEDKVHGLPHGLSVNQLWHFKQDASEKVSITAKSQFENLIPEEIEGWNSEAYGTRVKVPSFVFSTDKPYIKTYLTID
jgi:hypothetical protein